MAVRDHLGAFRQSEEGTNRGGVARGEKIVEIHMPRAGDMPLTRVARVPRRAVVLAERSHVEQRQPLLAEPRRKLVPGDVGHSAAMTSSSAWIDGRSARRASQSTSDGYDSNETPRRSRALSTQGT